MKRRWSIWVREHGSDHEVELMQVDSNPDPIIEGLHKKMLTMKKSIFEGGKRKTKIPRYTYIHKVDNHAKG